jgi:hypothetical protein
LNSIYRFFLTWNGLLRVLLYKMVLSLKNCLFSFILVETWWHSCQQLFFDSITRVRLSNDAFRAALWVVSNY